MSPWIARVTFAVAVVASIASSQVVPSVDESRALDPLVLDNANPTQTYAIQIRFADDPAFDAAGAIYVELELASGPSTSSQELRVRLQRLDENGDANGTFDERTVVIAGGARETVGLSLVAWDTCEAATECIEDYTLTVARTAVTDAPAVGLGGTVVAESSCDEVGAEPTITIGVTVL